MAVQWRKLFITVLLLFDSFTSHRYRTGLDIEAAKCLGWT
jgi:hypothetical protein